MDAPSIRQMTHGQSRRPRLAAARDVGHEQCVVRNAGHHRRRVRVDDDLSKGVVRIDRLVDVDRELAQQLDDGRDSERVHPVLGLLQAEQTPAPGIGLHDGECEKPQRAVGKGAGDVLRVLEIPHHDTQQLSLVVDVDANAPDVLDELREPVGDPRIDVSFSAGMTSLRGLGKVVQRGRQMGSVRPHAAWRRELVGRPESRGFQLELGPRHHLLTSEHQCSVLGRVVDGRQHRARQAGGRNATWTSAAQAGLAVRVQRDDGLASFGFRGDIGAGAATGDDGVSPGFLVGKAEPALRFGLVYVHHALSGDLQRAHRTNGGVLSLAQLQLVPEERHRRLGGLAEFVLALRGNQELGGELHRFGHAVAGTAEEAPDIASSGVPSAHRRGGFDERLVCECGEERDGVEQIRLSDPVGAGNAREGAQSYIYSIEILEAVHLEACEHSLSYLSKSYPRRLPVLPRQGAAGQYIMIDRADMRSQLTPVAAPVPRRGAGRWRCRRYPSWSVAAAPPTMNRSNHSRR